MALNGDRPIVIAGAGPAGVTAALELVRRGFTNVHVFEISNQPGGISKTVSYKGNRMDFGGHRFFSKSDRVVKWWLAILPLQRLDSAATFAYQGKSADVGPNASGPDPAVTDEVMLIRQRISRIYFNRKLFKYPLSLTPDTVSKLGYFTTIRIALSYLYSIVHPRRPEQTLEDFFINRFGRRLYLTFFKSYTEKVWGVPCSHISAEWGAQRIKGLSIYRAARHFLRSMFKKPTDLSQKGTETTLIEQFMYPKLGPGQLWERASHLAESLGAHFHYNHTITDVCVTDDCVRSVKVRNDKTGETISVPAAFFISTMPVKELIEGMGPVVPNDVLRIAQGLQYRDFMTVGLLCRRVKLSEQNHGSRHSIPDNWIYVQEPDVKLGRIQIFNNWSPHMVKDPEKIWMGLEYFCSEGDELWSMSDDSMAGFAIRELAQIGVIDESEALDSCVMRIKKAYPAYWGTYLEFEKLREFTDGIRNLFLVGRNGMHRYNNQDHSMLTAIAAVDCIECGSADKSAIWDVNTEQEYHEETKEKPPLTAVENLVEAYRETATEEKAENLETREES